MRYYAHVRDEKTKGFKVLVPVYSTATVWLQSTPPSISAGPGCRVATHSPRAVTPVFQPVAHGAFPLLLHHHLTRVKPWGRTFFPQLSVPHLYHKRCPELKPQPSTTPGHCVLLGLLPHCFLCLLVGLPHAYYPCKSPWCLVRTLPLPPSRSLPVLGTISQQDT